MFSSRNTQKKNFLSSSKVMDSTPLGCSENSFSEYFDLRTLLCYLHFFQVTNPFIINLFILWFQHVEPCSIAWHVSHMQEPCSLCVPSPRFDTRWGLRKLFFFVFGVVVLVRWLWTFFSCSYNATRTDILAYSLWNNRYVACIVINYSSDGHHARSNVDQMILG